MKRIVYIFALILMVALTSCREGCYQPTRSMFGVGFLDSLNRKPLTVTGVTVKGLGSDSVLYNNASVSAIYLPLHTTKDSTNYAISFKNGESVINDTISVFHKQETQFVSPACGCVPIFKVDSFKVKNPGGLYKTIELNSPEVINVEQNINVKIYF